MALIRASILVVTLIATGCATPGPTAPRTPAPVTNVTAAPLPTIDDRGLTSGRLTCDQAGDSFEASALQGPGGAELGGDAIAAALRAVLADGVGSDVPSSGWHLVSLSANQAQFVAHGSGDSHWSVVALVREQSGWTMDLVGACRLQFVLGPGIKVASWWLDPAAAAPGPDATAFATLVDQECGGAIEGRILAPVVVYAPDAVVLVFGIAPPKGGGGGGQDSICVQSPPTSYRAVLTEPLGRRRLLDGGAIPPRDATKPPG